jgi:Lar family restriction alleviation protein
MTSTSDSVLETKLAEVRPCPQCGQTATDLMQRIVYVRVQCFTHGCEHRGPWEPTVDDAIAAWNALAHAETL